MGINFKRPRHPFGIPFGPTLVINAPNSGGGSSTIVTGIAPLALPKAKAKAINSLVQYGKIEQASTPSPSNPVDLVCNNGTIKYGMGKNWFDDGNSVGGYIDTTGEEVYNELWWASGFIAVKPGTQYYFQPNSNSGGQMKHAYYTSDYTFISYISSGAQGFTTPNNCVYMRFSYRQTSYNVQLELGNAPTSYEPYRGIGLHVIGTPEVLSVEPGGDVASLESLFAVADYEDMQDVISGAVTRKIGVKVLDGTEDGWTLSSTSQGVLRFYLPFEGAIQSTATRSPITSTHFMYGETGQDSGLAFISGSTTRVYFIPTDQTLTLEGWETWLAEQYAAGTPVIVLYPLNEVATYPVTPQPLQTVAGDNEVEITAEVEDIKLDVDYMT